MDFFKAIQLRSLRNVVVDGDYDYRLRQIFRWYSKNFHTPLHVVDELPLDHVLTSFFEDKYEDLDEDEALEEIRTLTETEEERRAREHELTEFASDADDWAAQIEAELREKQAQNPALKAQQGHAASIANVDGARPRILDDDEDGPPIDIAVVQELPDIQMSFLDDDAWERELAELDGRGTKETD